MIPVTAPTLPRYGQRSLAEVVPSLLAGLGVTGFANRLAVPDIDGVCLLLVDGLGWELLQSHRADAPFLASLTAGSEPMTAGFPATTATSIASLGTGVPAGQHGIVGYTFAPTEDGGLLNALTWREHGGSHTDRTETLVPERIQPLPTALQRGADAGVAITVVAPGIQHNSGLTRAALRGSAFRACLALGDLAAAALEALRVPAPALCYAYHGDLDLMGHVHGPGSSAWRMQLRQVDRLAVTLAEGLPPHCLLAVIADHGMVQLDEGACFDADRLAALQAGVRLLGGEVRVRHVYTHPGAQAEVLAAWRQALDQHAWVLSREEAVAAGWFGPEVSARVRHRIGDVVVAASGRSGVIRSVAEPMESRLLGHHGSLTTAEQDVPFLLVRG